MICNLLINRKCAQFIAMGLLAIASQTTLANIQSVSSLFNYNNLIHGKGIVQLGYFWSYQGKPQQINIDGLIGDYFTVSNHQGSNGLVGLGYYVDGQDSNLISMSYGMNAFYLPNASVNGTVIQEGLFTNLSYTYNVTHYPLYFLAKSTSKTNVPVTLDVGIGPNFMRMGHFHEASLDVSRYPIIYFQAHLKPHSPQRLVLG